MTTQVYRHRVRLITDAMIVRGISLGIESDKIDWLKDLYSYDGSEQYIFNYLTWDDERLTTRLLDRDTPDGYAKGFFKRLAERRLLKRIFSGRPTDFKDPEIRKRVFEASDTFLKALEEQVANKYSFDKNLVIAQPVSLKSVRAQTSEGEIIVLHPDGARPFHEESALFRSIDEAIREQYLEVYAPVEYADEKQKKRKRREFHSEIILLIEGLAGESNVFQSGESAGGGE